MIKRLLSLLILLSFSPLEAETPSYEKSISDLKLSLQSLNARGLAPNSYREYMSLYAQEHGDFIKIRKLWFDAILNLPTTLSSTDKDTLSELSSSKLLEQMSLDEIAYYAYVYEAWINNDGCRKRVLPLVNALNTIYTTNSVPFGLSPKSSVLLAYYMNYPPPVQDRSIHACLKSAAAARGVNFLKVPPLKSLGTEEESKQFSFEEQIPAGTYMGLDAEIQVYNSKVGIGLQVFNFCYKSHHGLEGKCFSDFGRQTSSRRD